MCVLLTLVFFNNVGVFVYNYSRSVFNFIFFLHMPHEKVHIGQSEKLAMFGVVLVCAVDGYSGRLLALPL